MLHNLDDPSASTVSIQSSVYQTSALLSSARSNKEQADKFYKRIVVLQNQIDALQEELRVKDAIMNKARKDYARDLQNRDNAMLMVTNPINMQHRETVKLTMNIFNFNDLMGLTPELVEFFNEKMNILREQAQQQLD